ncbi:MAG: adenylate/guanylate cyclase domain-containing protein, partial [Candidatus Limnocylindria bacterium]
ELLLAEGQAQAAIRELRGGWRGWEEVGAPYEAAKARAALGRAYRAAGDEEAADLELEAAQAGFERLGAAPDLRRVTELRGSGARSVRGAAERATRTFMFTDIVRSTPLAEALGDAAWTDVLRWHDETLRSLFAAHGGEEVDHAGDGFFVAFARPVVAIDCAIAIQRRLAEQRRTHGFAPEVRIGIHATAAAKRGGAYKGKGVHQTARIAALAGAGEIVASLETLDASMRYATAAARTVSLKGIAATADVVTIDWR